ncbi:hypothetical protein ACT3TZ_02435 [Brachybacterium sp. AOP25-B2-12]|uniref:hypothetical protein n=1 Tax=Brachybacterium sp. AOP25-B2-12 TaxID=3457710 RepID=UPI004033A103
MSSPGATPTSGGGRDEPTGPAQHADVMSRVRDALRPANLPLPYPWSVLEAAHRIRDLGTQRRFREAGVLADAFAVEPADLPDRVELLQSYAHVLTLAGEDAAASRVQREMVGLLDGAGRHDHARALLVALDLPSRPAAPSRGARAHGRRRADPLAAVDREEVDDAVLVVVEGLVHGIPDPGAPRVLESWQLEREEGRILSAIEALAAVQGEVVGDPEPILRLRLAKVLELEGRIEEASEQAGHVLDWFAERGHRADPTDIGRSAHGARTILARTLRETDPRLAAEHALTALHGLREVDEPTLRARLAADLVLDLVAAGLGPEAAYASRRLASLLQAVPREEDRVRPLLVVAAQRIQAGREDDALAPLSQARRIARHEHDHLSAVRADQLLGQAHRRAGRTDEAISALRSAAREARWLSDDLLATDAVRGRFLVAELEARAVVQRLALDAGRHADADAEGGEIIRRAERSGGASVIPDADLWDHVVDAVIGRMIATGLGLASGAEGVDRALYAHRRREARRLIDAVPDGHEERARFWSVYLTDRDAAMLDAQGRCEEALNSATRALDGWRRLGEDAHLQRMAAEVSRLTLRVRGDGAPSEGEVGGSGGAGATGGTGGGIPRRSHGGAPPQPGVDVGLRP